MRVKSIKRSPCSISWCPVDRPEDSSQVLKLPDGRVLNHHSLLSLGKRQSMDDAFESHCELEIIDTSPATRSSSIGRVICPTSSFLSIDWGIQNKHLDKFPLGLIAGGMEDGTVSIWNPIAIVSDKDHGNVSASSLPSTAVTKSLIHQSKVHTRSVSCVAWNPKENKYLASVGYDGQLFVWDFKHLTKPAASKPPTGQPGTDGGGGAPSGGSALSTVAWNPNVPYILAAASSIGETQIYDLRAQKIALNIRARTMTAVSSVVWNPSYARELCISYANNTAEIWDLKQPMSPKLFLEGRHRRNILDLSWNPHDSRVIFTTAEDNRGYLWNSRNGQCLMSPETSPTSAGSAAYGGRPGESGSLDLPSQASSNDPFIFDSVNFEAEWCPLRAGMLATSGSNGTISIFDVRDVCYEGSSEAEEFMRKPLNYTRPLTGVCFGFGGKFAHFGNEIVEVSKTLPDGKQKTSKKTLAPRLHISRVPIEQSVIDRARDFERMLESFGDEKRLQQLTNEKISLNRKNNQETELETWRLLQLFQNTAAAECKEQMLNFLGYSDPTSQLNSPLKDANSSSGVPQSTSAAASSSNGQQTGVSATVTGSSSDPKSQASTAQAARASGSGFDGEFLDESSDGTGDFDSILQTSASLLSPRSEEIAKQAMGGGDSIPHNPSKLAAVSSAERKFATTMPEYGSEDSPAGFGDDMDDEDFFGQLSEMAAASSVPTTAGPPTKSSPKDSSMITPLNEEKSGGSILEDSKLSDESSAMLRKFDMESEIDVQIKQCLIRGNYKQAAMIAFNHGRIADSLVFAHCGGSELFDEIRRLYFENHRQKFIANVFEHIVYNSYHDYVNKSELNEWKETLAIILQFVTDESECKQLCNVLAQRCRQSGIVIGATACLMCSNNVETLINLWTNEKQSFMQQSSEDVQLQRAIEKVLVFVNSEWSQQMYQQIHSLTDILKEYACLLANAGSLKTAADLLCFLTDEHKCGVSSKINSNALMDLLRRISQADPSLDIVLPATMRASHVSAGATATAASIGSSSAVGPSSVTSSSRIHHQSDPRRQSQMSGRRGQRLPMTGGRGKRPGPSRSGPQMMNDAGLIAQSGAVAAAAVSSSTSSVQSSQRQSAPVSSQRTRPPSGGRGRSIRGGGRGSKLPPSSGGSGVRPIHPSTQTRSQPIQSTSRAEAVAPPAAAVGSSGGGIAAAVPPTPQTGRAHTRPVRAGRRPPTSSSSAGGRGRGRGAPPPSQSTAPVSSSQSVVSRQQGFNHHPPPASQPSSVGRGAPRMGRGRGSRPASGGMTSASSQMAHGRGRGPPMMSGRGRGRGGPAPMKAAPSAAAVAPPSSSSSGMSRGQRMAEASPGPVPIASPTEFGNTTQGTGFYGETSLKRKSAADSAPLPPDALRIVDDVLTYVTHFSSMSLTMSESRSVKGLASKLETLRQAIKSGTLSFSVYSEVCEISSLLHSRQYDQSLKIVTKLVTDPMNFKLHQKWLAAFKTLIHLAKKYSV